MNKQTILDHSQRVAIRFGLCLFILGSMGCGQDKPAAASPTRPESALLPLSEKDTAVIAGRSYPTLRIDGLTWLAANLDLAVPDSWCYQNTPNQCTTYGRLYRWDAARAACEQLGTGWRLPADEDWRKLANAYGGYFDWLADRPVGDPVAANRALLQGGKSGFDARLGGWRGSNGGYDSQETTGFYWSSTEKDEDQAWFYIFQPERGKVSRRSTQKRMGMSCRCVREKE